MDNFKVPSSTNTVEVSIINSTTHMKNIPVEGFMTPHHPGHDTLMLPAYSFLITNSRLNRSIVFDLAIRKDWESASPPPLLNQIKDSGAEISVEKDVRDILEDGGVDVKTIEAIVWSHWHFDHIGDPCRFEPATKLIVGPAFKEHLLPAYPVLELIISGERYQRP